MNWRDIKELVIIGKTYKVIPVGAKRLEDNGMFLNRLARVEITKKNILMYNKIPSDEDYQEILLHEMTHIILDSIARSSHSMENSEEFVSTLSEQLYDTLKRNNLLA